MKKMVNSQLVDGYPMMPKQPGYPDSWKKSVIQDTGDKLIVPEEEEH